MRKKVSIQSSAPDGNELTAIDEPLAAALDDDRPTLIRLRTIIADPAPTKRNTAGAHGTPLGEDEITWPLCISASESGATSPDPSADDAITAQPDPC